LKAFDYIFLPLFWPIVLAISRPILANSRPFLAIS